MATGDTVDVKQTLLKATFLMMALSLLVFWLPIVGPLLAGFVGGRALIGQPKLALAAAALPALFVAVMAVAGFHFIPYPLAGLVAGGDFLRALLFDSVPLLVGATLASLLP